MNRTKKHSTTIAVTLLVAFLFRALLACLYKGFLSDTACFSSWATRVFTEGFANFYSPDVFTDYPPGYMYVLYIVGAVMSFFRVAYLSVPSLLLLKLPAILCDIAAGRIIYRIAAKRFSDSRAVLISCLYLFNPAVFINSSMWGQVDSVFTLAVLIMCLLLYEGKTVPAYFVYVIGVLLKPQTLVFTPLLLFGIYEHVFASNFRWKNFLQNLIGGLCAIGTFLLLCMPFGLSNVLTQYVGTLTSYPYISVNAYNFWGMLGLNWISQDTYLGVLTYAQLGTLIIFLLCLVAALLFWKGIRRADRYYLCGAFIILTLFLFSVRMHERYLFPVMAFLLLAYIQNGQKPFLYSYIALSLCHLGNVWHVLFYYDPQNYNRTAFSIVSISLLTVLAGFYFYRNIRLSYCEKLPADAWGTTAASGKTAKYSSQSLIGWLTAPLAPAASRPTMPLKRSDILIMAAISLFYALFAFYNLGILSTPETEYDIALGDSITLKMPEGSQASHLSWYLLHEKDITFSLEVRHSDTEDWTYVEDITMSDVFTWAETELSVPAEYLRLTNLTEDAHIGELVLTDSAGQILTPVNSADYAALFDENALLPTEINHLTGCYFDEIYYTRTAYEFLHGLPTYENTHPPFGKILMALGVLIWGTSPFGFRFMGALFGVLMLPIMYLLGRNISRNRGIGAFVCFLFAFDFMHFAQTRLTTIDVFITFFVILMYFFMEQYSRLSFYDTPLRSTWLPLGACGISFGFGIASKWTGFYAGAGLALLFFALLYRRYREYLYAKQSPKGSTAGISHGHILRSFKPYSLKSIGFCVIFFVVLPFIIYLLSYLPFVDYEGSGLLVRMLHNQTGMYNYHSTLDATHSYSSMWYEWPTMIRPIFYYSKVMGEDLRRGISSFGNPLVWWAGIPAFLYTMYLALKKRDRAAAFLCVGYLAEYLPWTLITRCTFIYHYFPSVPFIALMIGYSLLQAKSRVSKKTFAAILIGYAAAAFLLFLLFYPVLSGAEISKAFVVQWLRWLKNSWVFVI